MSFLAQLQAKYPHYTEEDYKQYAFWRENLEYIEDLVTRLISDREENETDAEALKRLGKLDLLLHIKNTTLWTEKALRKLNS